MVEPVYKQTEIGVIPEDWKVASLSEVYDLSAGGDLNTSDYSPVKTKEYSYCILSNSLENAGIYGYCSKPQFRGNSITITGRGDIGHSFYREKPFSAIIRLLVCQPKSAISSKFVAEYLETKKPFIFESTGVPQLTVPQIKNTKIPVPPLPEQQRITEALSDMDELISSLEKLIAKKKAIKQGAMQELLAGKRRLPGFSGEWKSVCLADIGHFNKGSGISRAQAHSGKLPAVRYGELYTSHSNYIKEYYSHISNEVAESALPVSYGTILFAASGETKEEIGKCAAIVDNQVVYAGGDILAFVPAVPTHPVFLGTLLNTAEVCKQKAQRGQGDAVVHIHADSLSEITVSIPAYEEQAAIADVLLATDESIETMKKKLLNARQIKQGMMQQLLTGKIRLE